MTFNSVKILFLKKKKKHRQKKRIQKKRKLKKLPKMAQEIKRFSKKKNLHAKNPFLMRLRQLHKFLSGGYNK